MQAWLNERGLMTQTSGDISNRTSTLMGAGASAYGSEQSRLAAVQSAQIQANATMQAARMAQSLGYDQLAAEMAMQGEQLYLGAEAQRQGAASNYLSGVGNTLGNFGVQNSKGPNVDPWAAFAQGALGGGMMGAGLGMQGGYSFPSFGFGGGSNNMMAAPDSAWLDQLIAQQGFNG